MAARGVFAQFKAGLCAGLPEQRHEPDVGEVNHPYLFSVIDELGYDGWIGCEYRPRAGTTAGLGWLKPYL